MRYISILSIFFFSLFASFEDLSSFSADFNQVVKSENSQIKYSGKILLKEPHFALWRYKEPIPKDIYINGREFIIYEPDLEQANISSAENSLDLFSILRRSKRVDDGVFLVEVDSTEFKIESHNGTPSKISYIDKLENSVDIEFFNVEKNIEIDNREFIFTPSNDIDIIRSN